MLYKSTKPEGYRTKLKGTLFALFMITGCYINSASAQTNMLTPLSTTVQQLNTEQTIRYNKVIAQNMHSNYQFVHIEPIATAQLNGKIAVSFTNAPCPTTYFLAENVEYNTDDSDYTWYGNLIYEDSTSDCDLGSAMILAKDGEHFGRVQIQNRTYELIELTGGVQLIAEINPAIVATGNCGFERTTNSTAVASGVPGNNFCKIRVLVLYTPAAKAFEVSMKSRIDLAMLQTKMAMINSDVMPINLDIELAGRQEVAYTESPFNISSGTGGVSVDLAQMSSFGSALNTQVNNYKNIYQADIVLMLVKPNFSDRTTGSTAGLQSPYSPYSVVQSSASTGVSYTFAHELGHILGADHEENEGESIDPSPRTNIAHAHIIHFKTTRGVWPFKKTYDNSNKTLVYGGSGGDPSTILNYSNPYVLSNGQPTGKVVSTLGARNAAQHFKNIACIVAGYNPVEPGNFRVSTSGAGSVCAGTNATVYSKVEGPVGSYTYEWTTSTDGINFGPVVSVSPNYTFVMPASVFWFYAKLKVTSSSSGVLYSNFSLRRRDPGACNFHFANKNMISDESAYAIAINPIPANNNIEITFNLAQASDANIDLYDYAGRLIGNLYSSKGREGLNKIQVNTSELSNGMYLIKLNAGTYHTTQKLVIQH